MTKLFISHSSRDDAFVRDLRAALSYHDQEAWIDSRELHGGDPLLTEIQKAIDESSAYMVVISPNSLQSKWVGKELKYALKVQEQRGQTQFPVIPISLDGTRLGMMEELFDEEPTYISVSSEPGGIEAEMNRILVALGQRLAADVAPAEQPQSEPLEELVLELTDLKFVEQDGMPRASARARLIYEPAAPQQPAVKSEQSWRLVAPLGTVEGKELRWYLEKYAEWPSHYFRDRARKVEESLVKWGQLLHKAAMPVDHTKNVMDAWATIDERADRRFSIYVDTGLEAGAAEADVKAAREAATMMLALPWELLHDGDGYLFQGAKAMRVRRRIPSTKVLDVPVVATPIRILVVTARPEDDACAFIDHRTSALPLVEAMESLPGLVKIHVLSPPTLPALRDELERARKEKKPYHVVHFDGHGVFDPEVGRGGLCFENPDDRGKLEKRRHVTVFTSELGPLLRDHRIPLVFLEACQTAHAEKASESVASELLKVGVASVVAMSHNILIETSRRFVEAFYKSLAHGDRVGDAMLAGQRELKDDTSRGSIFGAGELRLEDWFVPVLYQEKDDPQLFKVTPTKQTQKDFQIALNTRLGNLPREPETGFVGRSRDLLALQRLLRSKNYAVVRGQGGEGKTTLAVEFARWMVRSQQMHRAAFVSVETHSDRRAFVEALGKQLIKKNFSAEGDLDHAILELERALTEQIAVLIIDDMQSVLQSPFIETEVPKQEAAEELKAILALCEQLLRSGDTRVIFTSREALPEPFDAQVHRRELHQLDRKDGVKLIERLLNATTDNTGTTNEAAREEIEELVEAVHCHACTLALLAPSLRERDVATTRQSIVELMADMEKRFRGNREKSVFASVELSLSRMSKANRTRATMLSVFHGAVNLDMLCDMMEWEEADVASLGRELLETGLASQNPYNHLTLNPALCPYLRAGIEAADLEDLTGRWVEAMSDYTQFLRDNQSNNVAYSSTLTLLELPNLFALLDIVERAGDAEATIALASNLHALLQTLGKPRLVERVCQVRDAAAETLGTDWNQTQFEAAKSRIEQQLEDRHLEEALIGAQELLNHAQTAGENAYPNAAFDLAYAGYVLARALKASGRSHEALPLLQEAQKRFEAIPDEPGAVTNASVCITEAAECLFYLGRYDEAMAAYEEGIKRDEKAGDHRGITVAIGQIGIIRREQGFHDEALEIFAETRQRFEDLNEPGMVSGYWYHAGLAYEQKNDPEAAEDAYRQSLAIDEQLGNVAAQASSLERLGNLYSYSLGRLDEAVTLYQQALAIAIEVGDVSMEELSRINLADVLRQLKRFDEARQEIQQAIKRKAKSGNASEPWTPWAALAAIEADAGNSAASAEAKSKALAFYLTYRRNGGENHDYEGDISFSVIESLLADDKAAAESQLKEAAAGPDVTESDKTFIRALEAIVAGSRDTSLAEAPELNYLMAAEIIILIETLENRRNEETKSP